MVSFEYRYFLASLGILCCGFDDSVDMDLLAVCLHQSGHLAGYLCNLPIHHDCLERHGSDLPQDVSSAHAISIDSDGILL